MTLFERVTAVLENARVAGGWTDEGVARRVLVEMREPDEAMIIAGVRFENIGDMAGRYRAMIDAALAEGPTELPEDAAATE